LISNKIDFNNKYMDFISSEKIKDKMNSVNLGISEFKKIKSLFDNSKNSNCLNYVNNLNNSNNVKCNNNDEANKTHIDLKEPDKKTFVKGIGNLIHSTTKSFENKEIQKIKISKKNIINLLNNDDEDLNIQKIISLNSDNEKSLNFDYKININYESFQEHKNEIDKDPHKNSSNKLIQLIKSKN